MDRAYKEAMETIRNDVEQTATFVENRLIEANSRLTQNIVNAVEQAFIRKTKERVMAIRNPLMFSTAVLMLGAAVWAAYQNHNWKMAVVYGAYALANYLFSTIG